MGFPEERIPLAQTVLQVVGVPKNNSVVVAIDSALDDIQNKDHSYPAPDHLKDTHYRDSKMCYGYGVGYRYPHDYCGRNMEQEYLPEELREIKYVSEKPTDSLNKKGLRIFSL